MQKLAREIKATHHEVRDECINCMDSQKWPCNAVKLANEVLRFLDDDLK